MNYCTYCMEETKGTYCPKCGKAEKDYIPAAHHLQPGSVLNGKYLVGAVLGEGGFGITYIGHDLNLDMKIAIKEYYPSGLANRNTASTMDVTASVGQDKEFYIKGKKSFLAEARTLGKFANEINVVTVRDFFEENGTAYIIMDYLEGEDLKTYLERRGVMSFAEAYTLLSPIMSVLGKIHAKGLIHRDISPSNIMILSDGTVKLLDFGAARNVSGADEKSLSIMLKPGFAPEEQYRSKGNQGAWTDVYALSATLYKMVTGVTPDDAMNRLFSDEVKSPSEYNIEITKGQADVILKGMSVYQKDRYQSMEELQEACRHCCGESVSQEADQSHCGEPVSQEKTVAGSSIESRTQTEATLRQEHKEVGQKTADIQSVIEDKDHKKPKIWGLVGSIISGVIALIAAFMGFVLGGSDSAARGAYMGLAVFFAVPAVWLGYFYYPRLEKKARKRYVKIYCGVFAAIVAAFVLYTAFVTLNTISIGDQKIKKTEETVEISADLLTDADIEKLTQLRNLKNLTISTCFLDDADVETIAKITGLESLSLSGNSDIRDVTPLKALKELQILNLDYTSVEDLTFLIELTKLKTLSISGTKVTAETIQLPESVTAFCCNNNELADINFLEMLENLHTVELAGNSLTDVSALSGKKLLTVNIDNNQVSDITPIAQADSTLYAGNNLISDISCLKDTKASWIRLSGNQISDISVFYGKDNISSLELNQNNISDISPLRDCFKIMTLFLDHNQIEDISAIATIDKLEILNLSYNRISDISPLGQNQTLMASRHAVYLQYNEIKDISVLANFRNCESMWLNHNQIEAVSPLANCTALNTLYLDNNQISDISPLYNTPKLRALHVVNNPITKVENLLLQRGDGIIKDTSFSISYAEEIDWEKVSNLNIDHICVYDILPRQKEAMKELGYRTDYDSSKLEEEYE